MSSRFNCIVVPVALMLAVVVTKAYADNFTHKGRVVEFGKGEPLSVDIKAWEGAQRTGDREACPLYGESALDSTVSKDSDGSFQLQVTSEAHSYTTTYCRSGYYPRTDRSIPNHKSGPPVIPFPAEVFPRSYSKEVYDEAVKGKVIAAINDLFYLQSIDPQRFGKILNDLESHTRKRDVTFVRPLKEILRQWDR